MSKALASDRHGCDLKLHRGACFGEVSIAPPYPQNQREAPFPDNGTVLAINYLTLGVAAHLPRRTGRGGARNSASRESHALGKTHVANLLAATRHAEKIGLPFTRMISIHWEAAGVPAQFMARATGRFTDLMTKMLARHGSCTAWLWTHENGDRKGGHCHLLAHVPAALVPLLTKLQKGWLRRITGKPYRARVIHSKPIGGKLGLENGNPELHAVNLERALSYLLKGADEKTATKFVLQHEQGGRVIGKRCGTSQNIGPKARKLMGKT
jgi:hypothetical protein